MLLLLFRRGPSADRSACAGVSMASCHEVGAHKEPIPWKRLSYATGAARDSLAVRATLRVATSRPMLTERPYQADLAPQRPPAADSGVESVKTPSSRQGRS